jgi:hypothetical protein
MYHRVDVYHNPEVADLYYCPSASSRAATILVGQDGILRADWQSAQTCRGYRPETGRLTIGPQVANLPHKQTDPLTEFPG